MTSGHELTIMTGVDKIRRLLQFYGFVTEDGNLVVNSARQVIVRS